MLKAVILTLNEERHIVECIQSLQWTDGVVVFDSFSSDQTVPLARQAGAEIIQHTFENYAQQRNAALDAIEADWILFIDADERATPELGEEIRAVTAQAAVPPGDKAGWWIPRHNYIFGHRMRGTGWWPDHQLRLLRHGYAHYERDVHEIAIINGNEGYLNHPMIHYNYETLAQFTHKQQRYVAYDTGILLKQRTLAKFYTPYTQALRHFWWRFITLRGWQDGLHGILLSGMMGYYEMLKYRQVRKAKNSSRS
ncbi:MAG: glycosyltransferase family 2 protein [Anaerolineae bacterium]|nr:glycosyltransferase family 2 protein [Anaerolineae bacterium]